MYNYRERNMLGISYLGRNSWVSKISAICTRLTSTATLLIFWNTWASILGKNTPFIKTKQQKSSLHSTSNCNLYLPPYFRLAAYLLEPPKKSQQIKISQSVSQLFVYNNSSQQQKFLHLKKLTTTPIPQLQLLMNYYYYIEQTTHHIPYDTQSTSSFIM